jgi:hypothetical protein
LEIIGRRSNHEESRCWKKKKDIRQQEDTRSNIASSNHDWPPGFAFTSLCLSNLKKCNQTDWYADSGASQHISDQLWQFQNYNLVKPGSWPVKSIGLDNDPLQVHGVSDIPIRCQVDGNWFNAVIQNVFYVPGMGANLFSIRCATKLGAVCTFSGEMLTFAKEEKVLAVGVCQSSNLYRLDIQSTRRPEPGAVSSVAQLAKSEIHSMSVWHQRLGHLSGSTIKKKWSRRIWVMI